MPGLGDPLSSARSGGVPYPVPILVGGGSPSSARSGGGLHPMLGLVEGGG